jgi:hypothetical protein
MSTGDIVKLSHLVHFTRSAGEGPALHVHIHHMCVGGFGRED